MLSHWRRDEDNMKFPDLLKDSKSGRLCTSDIIGTFVSIMDGGVQSTHGQCSD